MCTVLVKQFVYIRILLENVQKINYVYINVNMYTDDKMGFFLVAVHENCNMKSSCKHSLTVHVCVGVCLRVSPSSRDSRDVHPGDGRFVISDEVMVQVLRLWFGRTTQPPLWSPSVCARWWNLRRCQERCGIHASRRAYGLSTRRRRTCGVWRVPGEDADMIKVHKHGGIEEISPSLSLTHTWKAAGAVVNPKGINRY